MEHYSYSGRGEPFWMALNQGRILIISEEPTQSSSLVLTAEPVHLSEWPAWPWFTTLSIFPGSWSHPRNGLWTLEGNSPGTCYKEVSCVVGKSTPRASQLSSVGKSARPSHIQEREARKPPRMWYPLRSCCHECLSDSLSKLKIHWSLVLGSLMAVGRLELPVVGDFPSPGWLAMIICLQVRLWLSGVSWGQGFLGT